MANYLSSFTGAQIDAAVAAAQTHVQDETAFLALNTDTTTIGKVYVVDSTGAAYTCVASGGDRVTTPAIGSPALMTVRPNEFGQYAATAWGLSDVATDQRSVVQAMLDSGERSFVFPRTTNRIIIDGNCNVYAGQSLNGGRFSIPTRYCQTFDVANGEDGTSFRDMDFLATYDRTYSSTSFRGDNSFSQSCPIWIGSSGNLVDGIRVRDSVTGVWLSCWDGSANTPYQSGNTVRNFRMSGTDFGLLAKGQENVSLSNMLADDVTLSPGSPNPGHLIYFTGDLTTRSRGVSITNVVGADTNSQHLVQLKWIDGLSMSGVSVENGGAVSMTSVTAFSITGVSAKNASDCGGIGAVYVFAQSDNEANLSSDGIIDFSISMSADSARSASIAANRVSVTGRIANNISTNQSSSDVVVGGSDNRVSLAISQRGAGARYGVWVRKYTWITDTKRNLVDISGNFFGGAFLIDSASTEDSVIKYDPQHVVMSAASGTTQYTSSHAGTRTVVSRGQRDYSVTLSGGGTPTLAFSALSHTRAILTVSDGSAYGINAPQGSSSANTPYGTHIEIMVVNSSGGSLGTFTWNAKYVWTSGSAPTLPASGKSASWRFMFDGTNWLQV